MIFCVQKINLVSCAQSISIYILLICFSSLIWNPLIWNSFDLDILRDYFWYEILSWEWNIHDLVPFKAKQDALQNGMALKSRGSFTVGTVDKAGI